MRIILAIVSFAAAAALFGYFGLCAYQAISELGIALALQEIIEGWENLAILGGCLLFGATLLISGVAALVIRPERGREIT